MLIYCIYCEENNKYYVGQHVGTGLQAYLRKKLQHARQHTEKNNHIYSALRKYPFESFSIWPLAEVSTKDELDNLERLWIIALDARNDEVGMNIAAGGEGGWLGMKHKPESIEKMRVHPNRPNGFTTEKQKADHSVRMAGSGNPMFGKKRTMDERTLISTRRRSHPSNDPDFKWCGRCQKFVAIIDFYRANTKFDGLSHWCKNCHSQSAKLVREAKAVSFPFGWNLVEAA